MQLFQTLCVCNNCMHTTAYTCSQQWLLEAGENETQVTVDTAHLVIFKP